MAFNLGFKGLKSLYMPIGVTDSGRL